MINNKVSEEVKQNQDCKVVSPDAERWKKIDELEQQITMKLKKISWVANSTILTLHIGPLW